MKDITPAVTLGPGQLASLPDEALLEAISRQTFRYFWEGAHPVSGLALDRRRRAPAGAAVVDGVADDVANGDVVAVGGSGFGMLALIVAVERGWIARAAALERLDTMLRLLLRARCYHGVLPHFLDGRTGATIAFGRKDDGGDLVEMSLLCMGLLCAREYFDLDGPVERRAREACTALWEQTEWSWYTQGRQLLYWHWSPNNGWAMDHEIHGWNECLITYLLAASSPRYPIDPPVYERGFTAGNDYRNGRRYYGIELPLGMPFGGPLFFAHYSFCALDPRGLRDRHTDYWQQNVRHVAIHQAHGAANPGGFRGYGPHCWGLTASDDPDGYLAHAPDNDNGTISPTAALASCPYAPAAALEVARHLLRSHGEAVWGEFGFIDALCEERQWFAETFLAIDQGPVVVMMENHRSGLLWRLFMRIPDIRRGLARLGFACAHPGAAA
jgi:hypothetical protein